MAHFCTGPIEEAHSQSNELDKKCKKSFFIFKKLKNAESAQLCKYDGRHCA